MTKGNQKPKAKTSKRDGENSMWSWFEDLVIDGRLLSFTDHAGIKLEGVPPAQVWETTLKRNEEAIAAYQHAVSLQPDSIQVLLSFGEHLQEARRFEEAAAAFGRVVDLDPNYCNGWLSLGAALLDPLPRCPIYPPADRHDRNFQAMLLKV